MRGEAGRLVTLLVTVGVLLFATPHASHAAWVRPEGVASTSFYMTFLHPDNVINGSGLSAESTSGTHSNSAADLWHSGVGYDSGGAAPVVDDQELIFTLPGAWNLSKAYFWNMNQGGLTTRSIRQYDLLVSSNGTTWTAVLDNDTLNQAGGSGAEPVQTKTFAQQNNVRFVKLGIDTDWSGAANDYVGLSEIRFEGTKVGPGVKVTPSFATTGPGLPTPPSSTDLLHRLIATSSLPIIGGAGPVDKLTDGIGSNDFSHRVIANDVASTWVLTFDLNLKPDDIALMKEINVYTYNTDNRRIVDFDVEVSRDGLLWEYLFQGANNYPLSANPAELVTLTSLTQDAGGYLAMGRWLRFDFRPTWVSVRQSSLIEIDVVGIVTPEPGTLSLCALGGLAALVRRRRAARRAGSAAVTALVAALVLCAAPLALAVPVPLQQATATFHQGNYGSKDQTIDGNLGGGSGMGFFNARQANTLMAWETQADLTGPGLLTFTITQSLGAGHTLQRFRLAATGAPRSLYADNNPPNGAETPAGDVDPWPLPFTLLRPLSATSAGGATLTIGPNHIITVSGTNPGTDTYTITARTPLPTITGFRLEALPGPDSFVGRSAGAPHLSNGNAVLNEFAVGVAPGGLHENRPVFEVPLQNPSVTYEQGAPWIAANSIDSIEHGNNGWGVFPNFTVAQTAVFQTAQKAFAEGLVLELDFTDVVNAQHKMQHFRLSYTTDPNPTATNPGITWTPFTPSQVLSLGGATMTVQPDSSVVVSGYTALPDLYQVIVDGSYHGITGFRLEAMLGANGLLGFNDAGGSGNFVLSELNVFGFVPEPGTLSLCALGALAAVARRRRAAHGALSQNRV